MNSDDQKVLSQLKEKLSRKKYFPAAQEFFRNKKIAELLAEGLQRKSLDQLEECLRKEKALEVNLEERPWQDVDSEEFSLLLARASSTTMWPMGTHCWARDNTLIADRLLNSDDSLDCANGKKMLLSQLTIISSLGQLKRFEELVKQGRKLPASEWPHIWLDIKQNLNGSQLEPWMHVQDAWQMLGYTTLKALQRAKITVLDLSKKHKQFLAYIVPCLAAIDFATHENAGSWEEFCAIRNSVLSWEIACLDLLRLREILDLIPEIEEGYTASRRYLPATFQKMTFEGAVKNLLEQGKAAWSKNPSIESPAYPAENPRYRGPDAALIYTLLLDLPEIMSPENAKKLEEDIYVSVQKLKDGRTGGYYRYLGDNYQRSGYFRPSVVKKLQEFFGGPSGEVSEVESLQKRDSIIPIGRSAAWSHFAWQLSSWAGKKFIKTGNVLYKDRQMKHFLEGLSMVTGEDEWSLEADEKGTVEVKSIPAFRLPECYISENFFEDEEMIFPSPHTPLNWSVGEAIEAFRVMRETMVGPISPFAP